MSDTRAALIVQPSDGNAHGYTRPVDYEIRDGILIVNEFDTDEAVKVLTKHFSDLVGRTLSRSHVRKLLEAALNGGAE